MKPKALAGLLVGGLIIYSGLWYSMGLKTERQIVEYLDDMREQGVTVSYGSPELTGFPYRMEITFRDLKLDAKRQGWRMAGKSVTAIGHVWTPAHWFVRLREANFTAFKGMVSLVTEDSLTSVKWGDSGTVQIGSDLSTLTVRGRIFGSDGIKADKAELHLLIPTITDKEKSGLLSSMMFKGNLRVAQAGNSKRDYRPLDRGEVIFALHGSGLDAWSEAALARWRDNGGTFEISALDAAWGPSRIEGNASLTIDEDFMPLGAATVTLDNADHLLDNLEKLKLLSDRPNEDSGTLALMAQAGRLTANGRRIAKLKSVAP